MRLLLSVFHRRQQPRRLVHKNFHSISRRLAHCFKNFNPLKTEWSEVVVGLLLLHHHHHPLPGWRRDTVPPTKCNVHSIKWLRTSRPLWKEKHHSQTMSEFLSWRRNGFNKKKVPPWMTNQQRAQQHQHKHPIYVSRCHLEDRGTDWWRKVNSVRVCERRKFRHSFSVALHFNFSRSTLNCKCQC